MGGNPLRYTDPFGLEALADEQRYLGRPITPFEILNFIMAVQQHLAIQMCNIDQSSNDENENNSNPYNGSVDEPVIVIDGNGNAIPVNTGESIGASPDGKWQEVKDKNKNPTGTRIDNGHPKTHDDPRAKNPHAHVPGVTNSDGTPWLPLK